MKLSIITVNRNDREGLAMTLESIRRQTVQPFEFIVIDGASSDGSRELLEQDGGPVSFWLSEPDNGIYQAMNKGVGKAGGDYCLFLNSRDTLASPDVVERLSALDGHEDIICGNVMIQTEPAHRKPAPQEVTMDFLFNGSICHQAALIRTELLRKHPYDEKLRIVADRKFFLQTLILDNSSYQAIDVDIANYDVHGFSARERFRSEQEYATVLEEMIPERIRLDYGRKSAGALYGDGAYEKMFLEIGRRNWRKPVYRLVRGLLALAAPFVRSTRFIRQFPRKTD
jgi:glycosyltransferase involved in cell wall biosynthesis